MAWCINIIVVLAKCCRTYRRTTPWKVTPEILIITSTLLVTGGVVRRRCLTLSDMTMMSLASAKMTSLPWAALVFCFFWICVCYSSDCLLVVPLLTDFNAFVPYLCNYLSSVKYFLGEILSSTARHTVFYRSCNWHYVFYCHIFDVCNNRVDKTTLFCHNNVMFCFLLLHVWFTLVNCSVCLLSWFHLLSSITLAPYR